MSFKPIESQMNLPKSEEEILDFWQKNKIFEKSLELTKDKTPFYFYDGPPFATGTPHYGHIVQSISKDVVPRYWTMRGRYVERKWGWDCHGLPIENIAEKELGIARKKDIEKLGVDKFNATCRKMVLSYVADWERVIGRLGRWADMKNAYKTMDLSYMESVWSIFKDLYDKGLVYEGYRSMHICPRCETTLSQSEVTEGYKMIKDLSAIAKFELVEEAKTYILAWTTTPWTLIGNVALAIGRNIDYVKVKIEGEQSADNKAQHYILAKSRVKDVLKDQKYEVVGEMKGHDLEGLKYKSLFDYYKDIPNAENGWEIYAGDFVDTEEGTGIVHIAPAFGEDDMNLGKEFNLPFIQHIGMDGIIKPEAKDFAGMSVKPLDDHMSTDIEIIKNLAHRGLLFSKEKYEHSYPHCWRCDTPLLNYATSSWFVGVTQIKDEMLKLAKGINWSPKHIKEGRFGNWLEGARDWSVSRQRYWASCMPIWKCEECGQIEVIGSIAELEKKSGQKVNDLHKDFVDKIAFPCGKCEKEMHRIPDVLDTWFDSGSMPYAQLHYPFENKDKFDKSFPADFIGEAQDQCRAWFYYLHVLATGVKSSIAFKNVLVSGMVLAEDGKKMSKKLQNYPDPTYMFDKYGADPLRFYLLTSPILQAENLNFSEKEVAELSRGIFRMLWNSYSFFILYANIDGWKSTKIQNQGSLLDQWIVSEFNTLVKEVNNNMEAYDLTKSTRLFVPFIDNLSNWYIRRSRKRFWKSENDNDKESAYSTLYFVLTELAKLMAPFTPFLADEIFRNMTGRESVHLESYPQVDETLIDNDLNTKMQMARKIVEMGLSARAEAKIKVRQPLNKLTYHGKKLDPELEVIIAEEVNVKKVENGEGDNNTVVLDRKITEELQIEGIAREIIRNIQSQRKESGFDIADRIDVMYFTDADELAKAISMEIVAHEVLARNISLADKNRLEKAKIYDIEGNKISIMIEK